MSRIARVVADGMPHHITQRGNNHVDVFFDDNDRMFYLQTLYKYSFEFKLTIWAYCLMSNHIHLLAIPEYHFSLSQGIGRTNLIYTQYINKKYNRSGRLWQNRFFSCPVDK
jgi:putative transposase